MGSWGGEASSERHPGIGRGAGAPAVPGGDRCLTPRSTGRSSRSGPGPTSGPSGSCWRSCARRWGQGRSRSCSGRRRAPGTGWWRPCSVSRSPCCLFGFGVFCARMGIGSRGRRVVVEGSRLTAYNLLGVRSAGSAGIASIDLRPRAWFAGTTLWTPLVSLQEGKDFWLDALLGRWASLPPAPVQLAMLHDIRARLGVDGSDGPPTARSDGRDIDGGPRRLPPPGAARRIRRVRARGPGARRGGGRRPCRSCASARPT